MLLYSATQKWAQALFCPFTAKKLSATLLFLIWFCSLHAQSSPKVAELEKIFDWATTATPGCVCAVAQQGHLLVNRAFGSADLERQVRLDTGSLFDIGSLRKQFIAASVLLLAEDGKLSLKDAVRKYIPELPDYGDVVTLDHLLTHTSGMRDWTALQPLSAGKTDALPLILRQRELNFSPGTEWQYSNSGYVLLKEIVVRVAGMPFADFARQRLFEPAGMTKTEYVEDMHSVVKNRALAYSKEAKEWKLDVLMDEDRGGGGALFTTAGDLLKWNEALDKHLLGKSVTEKLQQPVVLNNGRKLTYARGLFVENNDGERSVWHSGGAAGYHSWLGRLPDQGLSIAILCNSNAVPASVIANRVADLYLPAKTNTRRAPPGQGAASVNADVKAKAGLYFNKKTGEPLRLLSSNGNLGIAGGGLLLTLSENEFRNAKASLQFRSGDEYTLHFLSDDVFELKSMEGDVSVYERATNRTPATSELQALSGRYGSEEVGNVFQVIPEGTDLVLRFEWAPEKSVRLKAVAPGVFQVGMMTLRFHFDASGQATSFDYSNPLLRRLRFSRLKN